MYITPMPHASSSPLLNMASISDFGKMYGFPVFSFLFFLPVCFNKNKQKKWDKKEYLAVLFVLICELVCGN